MIFIKFKKGQGLGNQLWNYVALRAITDTEDMHVLASHYNSHVNFLRKQNVWALR